MMPQSSCSSAYIGILERISHQPLFVRFLQENEQAKSLLVDLLEKMATYPKDMLEVSFVPRENPEKIELGQERMRKRKEG